jgi:hypothetical protein
MIAMPGQHRPSIGQQGRLIAGQQRADLPQIGKLASLFQGRAIERGHVGGEIALVEIAPEKHPLAGHRQQIRAAMDRLKTIQRAPHQGMGAPDRQKAAAGIGQGGR